MEDPESARQLERHAELYAAAHGLGMRCAGILTVNGGFQDYPREWKAAPAQRPLGAARRHGQYDVPVQARRTGADGSV